MGCWNVLGTQGWANAWPFITMWILFKLTIWAGVVTAGVFAIRWLRRGGRTGPLEILKARYARGELSRQDFESTRQDLER
jgi:putative membrane protein